MSHMLGNIVITHILFFVCQLKGRSIPSTSSATLHLEVCVTRTNSWNALFFSLNY